MFCLGDIETALKTPTGQPYIAVILNATHSIPAATVLAVVILLLGHVLSMASRQLHASFGKYKRNDFFYRLVETPANVECRSFARDGGLPYSSWLSQVHPGWDV